MRNGRRKEKSQPIDVTDLLKSIPHSNPSLINYGPPSNTISHEYMQALMSSIVTIQKNTIE